MAYDDVILHLQPVPYAINKSTDQPESKYHCAVYSASLMFSSCKGPDKEKNLM